MTTHLVRAISFMGSSAAIALTVLLFCLSGVSASSLAGAVDGCTQVDGTLECVVSDLDLEYFDVAVGPTTTIQVNGPITVGYMIVGPRGGTPIPRKLDISGHILALGGVKNWGTIESRGVFENQGKLQNLVDSWLSCDWFTGRCIYIPIDGAVHNAGVLTNAGVIDSPTLLFNTGHLANPGVLINTGMLVNFGTISSTGTFTNSGTVLNAGDIEGVIAGAGTVEVLDHFSYLPLIFHR